MRLIVRDDATSAAKYVANYILRRIREFDPSPSRPFVLGLPTGSSPIEVYKLLVEKYKTGEVCLKEMPSPEPERQLTRRKVSFENVVTFNMVWAPSRHAQTSASSFLDIIFRPLNYRYGNKLSIS